MLRGARPPSSDARAPRLLTGGDALGRVAAGASITRLRVDGAAVLAAGLSSLAAAQALLLAGAAVPGRVEIAHWFGTRRKNLIDDSLPLLEVRPKRLV